MLFSHLSEENNNEAGGTEIKNQENEDIVPISQRDLVTLYENVDTKQTYITSKNLFRSSNQHVETIVYNEDQESEGSDVSEIYCNEDFYDMVLINKERIDLINNMPSSEKTLCHKFGDIAIQSDHVTGYKEHLLKNCFIKEQLNSLNNLSNFGTLDGTFFSTSLLDFICYNHNNDNSNFYMDNIIQYAKRTIDQLKRISNGDYLTERAKEKWRTLGNNYGCEKENKIAKVVVTRSNPLRVECKITTFNKKWNDLVQSELDITSLSKILKKRIVEIPRLIYGSYKLFSKRHENNLLIRCKKETQQTTRDDGKSIIDIVVQFRSSDIENLRDDIDSMLQQAMPRTNNESWLPLEYNCSTTNIETHTENTTISELNEYVLEETEENCVIDAKQTSQLFLNSESTETANTISSGLFISEISSQFSDLASNVSSEKQISISKEENVQTQVSCLMTSRDELFCSIQKFNTQTVLLEENEDLPLVKKKSPTKVRIKSPYENKSYLIEERKRRKFLEIRERRERRKKVLSENCKVTKHKHGKGAIMAQSSNSVTKLSITNKSFYTSIYGDNANNTIKSHQKKLSDNGSSEIILETPENYPIREVTTLKMENKKNLNRSYYLDDPETEIMNLQIKNMRETNDGEDVSTSSTSAIISDITMNFDSLIQTASDLKEYPGSRDTDKDELTSVRLHNSTPEGKTNNCSNNSKNPTNKDFITMECKKSIEKIYELMKRLSKVDSSESSYANCQFLSSNVKNLESSINKNLTIQATDSGTSLKHQQTSSNPSLYSFEETSNNEVPLRKIKINKGNAAEANVVSKVIISTKTQIKTDNSDTKPHKKVTMNTPENNSKNPLKAISNLINEFDHIQKSRQKTLTDMREHKRINNNLSDGKSLPRHSLLKNVSRIDDQTKDIKTASYKTSSPNDRKILTKNHVHRGKALNQQISNTNKNIDREKKITDIVDEALREARGEAVKGPSKPYTRLDSLAQPKRFNVNQNEPLRSRYGRSSISRAASPISEKPIITPATNLKGKQKRNEQENVEKTTRLRRMANNLSTDNSMPQINTPSYKQRNVSDASRTLKKIISTDSNIRKRPLSLSQTAATSNLLDKTQMAHMSPASSIIQNARYPTLASSPIVMKRPVDTKLQTVIESLPNESVRPLPVIKESKTLTMYNERKNYSSSVNEFKDVELMSICSDYVYDTLDDKDFLTAVSDILPKEANNEEDNKEDLQENDDNNKINAVGTNTIMTKCDGDNKDITSIEKILYNQLSQGSFQKRLKIKNLTLTPKQSLNQVCLLQCGDANSLLVKSCMSQNLQLSSPKTINDQIHIPLFSNVILDQNFPRLPVNITTVGYVFSKLQPIKNGSNTQIKYLDIPTPGHLYNKDVLIPRKYSNYEKEVQTVPQKQCVVNKDHYQNFGANFTTKSIQPKVNKSTDLSDFLKNNIKLNKTGASENVIIKSENINNTTSLDILVELLDEIEKISKYQSLKIIDKEKTELKLSYSYLSKPLEYKTVKKDNTANDDMKQKMGKTIDPNMPDYVDKEVAVNIIKECVNRFTNIPSQLCLLKDHYKNPPNSLTRNMPVTVSRPIKKCIKEITNLSSSTCLSKYQFDNPPSHITDILSQSSSRSLISLYDYRAYYLNKFKEPPIITTTLKQNSGLPRQSNKCTKNTPNDYEELKVTNEQITVKKDNNSKPYNVVQKDFDSMLKIKRDILVTVYSILVFTIFAALSFPEFLYHT